MQMSFFDFEEFNELKAEGKEERGTEKEEGEKQRKNLRRKRFTSCPLR